MARRQIVCTTSPGKGGYMICARCGNLLVEDRFMEWTARWRCLKCGHVHDSLSVQRFLEHQERAFFVNSTEPDYFDEEVHLGSESFVGPDVTSRRPFVSHSMSASTRHSKKGMAD